MKSLVLLLAVVICASTAFAQKDFRPGYVVVGGDTVKGLVQYRSKHNSEAANYKSDKRAATVSHKPEDISAWGFVGDKQYESIDIDTSAKTKMIFAQVLNRGEADLLYIDKKYFLIKDGKITSFERKPDVVVMTKSNVGESVSKFKYDTKYIQVLNMTVSDCGMTANKLKFSRTKISNLIDDYNQCKNNLQPLINTTPRISPGVYLSGGLIPGTLTLRGTKTSVKGDAIPLAEAGLELRFPRFLDKFAFNVGLQATKLDYQAAATNFGTTTYLIVTGQLKKIPISFKYSFGAINNSLYARIGTSISLAKDVSYVIGTNSSPNPANALRNSFGYLGGVGYDRKIFGRLRVFGEVRAEYSTWFEQTKGNNRTAGAREIEEIFTTSGFTFMLGVGI